MKEIIREATITGQVIRFTVSKQGDWHISNLNWRDGDAVFGGSIKDQMDRVALGRFLIEVGTLLATPKPKEI